MPSDMTRGAYAGKDSKLYINIGTVASPDWEEMIRAHNLNFNFGKALNASPMHGHNFSPHVAANVELTGSFDYTRKRGADPIWEALVAAWAANEPIHLRWTDRDHTHADSQGWEAAFEVGDIAEPRNAGDPVTASVSIAYAETYDAGGDLIEPTEFSGPYTEPA